MTLSDWNKIGTAVASALWKSNQRLAFPLQGPPATFRLRRTRVGQAISPSLFARPINRHSSLLQRYFSPKIISLYIQMLFASIYVFRLEISLTIKDESQIRPSSSFFKKYFYSNLFFIPFGWPLAGCPRSWLLGRLEWFVMRFLLWYFPKKRHFFFYTNCSSVMWGDGCFYFSHFWSFVWFIFLFYIFTCLILPWQKK